MNINAVIHPAGVLMNAGWIEMTSGNFLFYKESITPSAVSEPSLKALPADSSHNP